MHRAEWRSRAPTGLSVVCCTYIVNDGYDVYDLTVETPFTMVAMSPRPRALTIT